MLWPVRVWGVSQGMNIHQLGAGGLLPSKGTPEIRENASDFFAHTAALLSSEAG